jgi:hypothetical protein
MAVNDCPYSKLPFDRFKNGRILLANPLWTGISAQLRSDCNFKDVTGNALNLAVYQFANGIW